MKTIGVVTVSRSDYGLYRPILKRIESSKDLRLHLIVAGAHFVDSLGKTVRDIEADGFMIGAKVPFDLSQDDPQGIASSLGDAVNAFAGAFSKYQPDILLLLGDRFEMLAAGIAATPFNIPLAHVHGGEITEGAMDNAFRHSLTKLSHLHFVATEEYARRVESMGEESWRVFVSGAPGLDNLKSIKLLNQKEIKKQFGLEWKEPPLLVTFHPVTLESNQTLNHINELLTALEDIKRPVIFTAPNQDTYGQIIAQEIQKYVSNHKESQYVMHLGTQGYFSLMKWAAAMVGNSSSGIIEAPSFGLPVVNIGNRQKGRTRADNVIDVGNSKKEIVAGIKKALSEKFNKSLNKSQNPYFQGEAAVKIVNQLRKVKVDKKLSIKKFVDLAIGKRREIVIH